MANREGKQERSISVDLKTRDEGENEKIIEGYFAVFNSVTELFPGGYEEISTGAFDGVLMNDIKALINHDTSFVLGRNKADTLELKTDNQGLWGRIKINPFDTDAVNLYERVKRQDVDQCSIGFIVLSEETDFRDDGSIKWTMTEIDLKEVSVVTFPAYEATGVQARKKEKEQVEQRKLEQRKNQLKERLHNGIKATNDSEEN